MDGMKGKTLLKMIVFSTKDVFMWVRVCKQSEMNTIPLTASSRKPDVAIDCIHNGILYELLVFTAHAQAKLLEPQTRTEGFD